MKSLLQFGGLLAALPAFISAAAMQNSELTSRAPGGYVNFVYYTNWAIYGRNYQPQQLPSNVITHVLYAFADVQSDGTVRLTDSWSDVEKHYPTDSWNDVGTNVYGCMKQLYLLKQQNRNLKTLLSIGGWTYSPHFAAPMATEAGRQKFADTAVALVQDLGFDGLDIDWEYPANPVDSANFVSLLATVRSALDNYTTNYGGERQLLTAAVPAGPQNYNQLQLSNLNKYLDYFNLMAYDYMGGFSNNSGHQANLYPSRTSPTSTDFSTQKAVNDYLAGGVPANKIILGLPLYGRAFQNTNGLGQPFSGIGQGTWEAGVYDFKALPQPGAQEIYNDEAGALYSWDPNAKTIISYDNMASAQKKMQYIIRKGLGGSMFWEASGDRTGNGSLLAAAYNTLGAAGGIAHSNNTLAYPGSKYQNIRNEMQTQ